MAQLLDGAEVQREMKRCSKCKTEKPRGEFYKDKRASDGLKHQCKVCHMAGTSDWRLRHPAKSREIGARHYAKHGAKRRATSLNWKRRNPEKVAQQRARWKEANPDWMERYAEGTKRARRNWKKNNPEAVIEHDHRRRARLSGGGGSYTQDEIRALYAGQEGLCANQHCRTDLSSGFHRDHVTPIAAGGSNYITNIQLLCGLCNTMKGARPMEWLLNRTEGRANG